ncbi:MAG: right-handed parallel beta-helix repeat-containing protein [Zoogloea sp.]|nr:right-handed parallel beta-helix repeat-containing protein [Zoogloea sp.]
MNVRTALLAILLSAPALPAAAATVLVGPGESVTRIADAARLAKDGDTVLIRPGTYKGDVAVWAQKSLTIRGYGGRPVLDADGRDADGKGIWVFVNGNYKVENIEFRGARVADGNGAGIRFEQGSLEVRDCVFEDNQNGLITANFDTAELRIYNSSFSRAPREPGRLHHLLYVGHIKSFVLEGSRFHQGYQGHLVKSRAGRNEIRYNLLVDGPGGMASYELEFPEGGVAVVVGNVIAQSADSPNPIVVAYGAESSRWPENRLLMAHNTLINAGWRPAWFTRAWSDKLPPDTQIVTRNNLTVGLGGFSVSLPGDHRGNFPLPGGAIEPESLDFTPPAILRGRVDKPDGPLGELLTPRAEFALPIGTQPLVPPAAWAPGAFQSHGMVTRQPAGR